MLNLRKEQVLNLKKTVGLEGQKAEVIICMDYSGSMTELYGNGTVRKTIERIFPLAMAFDDDGSMPVYSFSNDVEQLEDVTDENIDHYDVEPMMGMGGTQYAPPLKKILGLVNPKKGGLFASMFGSKLTSKEPMFVIFITDGDNSDKAETEVIVRELAKERVFVQFVGIGGASFDFLKRLDDLS